MTRSHPTWSKTAAMASGLRASRAAVGLTIPEVAGALGKPEALVASWEHCSTLPKAPVRAQLAELYGVPEAVLFAELVAAAEELGHHAV